MSRILTILEHAQEPLVLDTLPFALFDVKELVILFLEHPKTQNQGFFEYKRE